MVNFQIASDLHIERMTGVVRATDFLKPVAPTLVLAGDIGSLYLYGQLKAFLRECCDMFENVLYIPGNHEFYRVQGYSEASFEELLGRVARLDRSIPNLTTLYRGVVELHGVMIIGCTLWSNPMLHKIPPYIVRNSTLRRVLRYRSEHIAAREMIERGLKLAACRTQNVLVVTHHSPTFRVLSPQKIDDEYRSLYASDLETLWSSRVLHTWVYGHTHHNCDETYEEEGHSVRVVSNQLGKGKDTTLLAPRPYSHEFIINIPA